MLKSLLDALTDRIAAGGTASAVSCSEHFSRPRTETALSSPQRTVPAGMTRDQSGAV